MATIPETDQWLLNGECSKCRRSSYCKTSCTKAQRRRDAQMYAFMAEKMNEATGGAFGEIMSHSHYRI